MQTNELFVKVVTDDSGSGGDSKQAYSEPQTATAAAIGGNATADVGKQAVNYTFTFDQPVANSSAKQSPNKALSAPNSGHKKAANTANNSVNNTQNKRTKGPLNHIKARLNLNIGADKRIAKSHVFNTTSPTASQSSAAAGIANRSVGHKSGTTAAVVNTSAAASGAKAAVNRRRIAPAAPPLPNGQQSSLHHSFISDLTDVRKMENTLLTLLEDFHSGKLRAFGQDITFEKMENVREQQERLARLHFDLDVQQEVYGHQTEEGKRMAKDNMTKLIANLQELSDSIEQLQSKSSALD